ncbi:MAG: alkyl hydroperoxide reductase [Bacillales bacterium]|jgi:DsbE subfamily thiol:disulfide oxidoreductase|nr:alkyl hydroperoxide reductase [Bacillales bacterium]
MSATKNVLSILILIFVIIAVVIVIKDSNNESKDIISKKDESFASNPIGKEAPNFSLKNMQGQIVKLSDYKGKKIMVNFWATWCPPCKEEVPEIEKFHKDNPDIIILSVNIDTTKDIQGFIDEYQMTFPVLLDDNKEVSESYGTYKIPETFFINADGIVKYKRVGAMDYNVMKTYFDIM